MATSRRLRCAGIAVLALALTWPACAAPSDDPQIDFVVVRSDTLIGLSRHVLVSPRAWREVARLNRLPDPNRIWPGQVLKIPTRLLRGGPVPARIVSVTGRVESAGAAVQPGMALAEGGSLRTGPDGSAVIELADRSRVQVPPSSLAELAASRRYGSRSAAADAAQPTTADTSDGWFAGTLRLLQGSVEVFATKVLRTKPLEVVTPTAVIGVRGTHYRVGHDENARASTHAEVIEGQVRFDATAVRGSADLPGGFGAQADSAAATEATALLPAPEPLALPPRFERPVVRFALPDAAGRVRVQVAGDPAFDTIVSDLQVDPGSEVRVADLADGRWHLRVRRVDPHGIEGHDLTTAFTLKARPEPPAYTAPRANGKQSVGTIELQWARNVEAPRVRVQIARDASFDAPLLERDELDAPALSVDLPEEGSYYWRLASIRPDGDHGPYGDVQRFELRPLPTAPQGGLSDDGKGLVFRWSGREGDRHQVELARDPGFNEVIARDEVDGLEWKPPIPSSGGRYYFRYRSIEPDGYVGPYSPPLMVELPRDLSFLLLLLPLALIL